MARKTFPLSDKEIKEAELKTKAYKLFDGGGLYLNITPKGQKYWRLKYRFEGKEQLLSLGVYPTVKLKEARNKSIELKKDIANGINPADERKQKKEAVQAEKVRTENTFEKIARERLLKVDISEAHYKRTLTAFENDAFPFIGNIPVDEVKAKDIISVIQRMEERGVKDSARKVFYSISKTYKWAVANGKAERSPAADIGLSELLGAKSQNHYPTITDDKGIGELLRAIDTDTGDYTTVQAMKMLAHTFVRPYNIRHAEWAEIDFKSKQWVIPSDKMKTKRELIVPLTDSTILILQDTQRLTGDAKYIFPSLRTKTSPLSDAALVNMLRRMGYSKEQMVAHSFRAMFSTVAHEKSGFSHEIIETQLAHSIGNSVSKAYNRAKYLPQRKKLMKWWSNFLESVKAQ